MSSHTTPTAMSDHIGLRIHVARDQGREMPIWNVRNGLDKSKLNDPISFLGRGTRPFSAHGYHAFSLSGWQAPSKLRSPHAAYHRERSMLSRVLCPEL
jgi:hypothetical protein